MREASILCIAACALCACNAGGREPAPVQPVEQHVVAAPEAPKPSGAPPPAVAPPVADLPAAQWDQVELEDEVPLCVFADHDARQAAPFLQDVRKQTLRANATVVFGAFSPECLNEACDSGPLMQCRVDSGEEPNTLVVRSRLSYKHKRGAVCTTGCRRAGAGCETTLLKPGKYTVKYGARTFSLRIPSVRRDPCFKLD